MFETYFSLMAVYVIIAILILKVRGTRRLSVWLMAWFWPAAAFYILFVIFFVVRK